MVKLYWHPPNGELIKRLGMLGLGFTGRECHGMMATKQIYWTEWQEFNVHNEWQCTAEIWFESKIYNHVILKINISLKCHNLLNIDDNK